MSDKKENVIKEAIFEVKKILEAADKTAYNKIKNTLPENFDKILKEELNKVNNKESVNESKNDKVKESINKDKKNTDNKKESINETNDINLTEASIDYVEEAYNEANSEDEFVVQGDDDIDMSDIESELDEMEELSYKHDREGDKSTDVEETNDHSVEEGKSDPYAKIKEVYETLQEMVHQMDEKKYHDEMNEKFHKHMTETYGESYKNQMDENHYKKMYEMYVAHQKGEPFDKDVKVNEMHEKGPDSGIINKMHKGDLSPKVIEEKWDTDYETPPSEKGKYKGKTLEDLKKMKAELKKSGPHKEGSSDYEKQKEIDFAIRAKTGWGKVDEENEEERHDDEKINEIHGQSYSAGKVRSGSLPNDGAGYRDRPGHSRNRPQWSKTNEGYSKKINGLLNNNKKVTKELNETKTNLAKVEKLLEDYKNVLVKYRSQLQEMAVFNTNLSNVNNILVNEEFALTTEDKNGIISKFKNINSITESENQYKSIINDLKKSTKNIIESVKDKVNNNVTGVSAVDSEKVLNEQIVEKTAYGKNPHVAKIKELMNYVDKK